VNAREAHSGCTGWAQGVPRADPESSTVTETPKTPEQDPSPPERAAGGDHAGVDHHRRGGAVSPRRWLLLAVTGVLMLALWWAMTAPAVPYAG